MPSTVQGLRSRITARSREALEDVAAELGNDPVVLEGDLADPEVPAVLARRALDALGQVDILVNNAAIAFRMPTEDYSVAIVDQQYAVNMRAPLLLVAALIPAMRERGSGSIINLSSVSGLVGTPKRAAYAATKGAIDAATRSLAMELGDYGIRVNAVAPGVVDTDLWARNKSIPGVVELVNALTPLGRWAVPDDVADVVVFLASDAARFVTGETMSADGGMAKTLDLYGGPT